MLIFVIFIHSQFADIFEKFRSPTHSNLTPNMISASHTMPIPSGRRRSTLSNNLIQFWILGICYLVSVRIRLFFAISASICRFACAANKCSPPLNPLISLNLQKIPRFQLRNCISSHHSFRMRTI
jgi:hypothetical protein